ncbi:hypothetical protein VPH35_028327 [Triticum aestivum]
MPSSPRKDRGGTSVDNKQISQGEGKQKQSRRRLRTPHRRISVPIPPAAAAPRLPRPRGSRLRFRVPSPPRPPRVRSGPPSRARPLAWAGSPGVLAVGGMLSGDLVR